MRSSRSTGLVVAIVCGLSPVAVHGGPWRTGSSRLPAPQTIAPALLDLNDVIARTSRRRLDGVFIQQEQEGSLVASDPREPGDVFRYYRPTQIRPDLAAAVAQRMTRWERLGYRVRRAAAFFNRGDPYAAWDAWPPSSKVAYLGLLEESVIRESGHEAAWNGKETRLLERRPNAPDYLARHPQTEPPPAWAHGSLGARFLQPEIVTDKDHPAATIDEAFGRMRQVIADTGHAGVHFHVFVKQEPAKLLEQLPALQGMLQLVNNVLFARAALDSHKNLDLPALFPWHEDRGARVAALLEAASEQAHRPKAEDPDSEKNGFVGFRYWGKEEDKAVVSLEYRGVNLPWRMQSAPARIGDVAQRPRRDESQARLFLTFLALYAERLAAGRAPLAAEPSLALDLPRAEAMLQRRARELSIPEGAYYGVEAFSRRLTGHAAVAAGHLFPFAVAAFDPTGIETFMDGLLEESARARAADQAGVELNLRAAVYQYWSAYSEWARAYEARVAARFERVFAVVTPSANLI